MDHFRGEFFERCLFEGRGQPLIGVCGESPADPLGEFDQNVANKAICDYNFSLLSEEVHTLHVANEVHAAVLEYLVGLLDLLVALI